MLDEGLISIFSEFNDNPDEAVLLAAITKRVEELMEHDIELLFSYLYRLDVKEEDIHFVMNVQKEVPVIQALAKLIFDRQIMRHKLRQKYKQEPIEGWDDW